MINLQPLAPNRQQVRNSHANERACPALAAPVRTQTVQLPVARIFSQRKRGGPPAAGGHMAVDRAARERAAKAGARSTGS
jgi:hypothetical protein